MHSRRHWEDLETIVGSLGNTFAEGRETASEDCCDQQMTAQPGDVILYNGSNICLFYGSNSWSYTRLGKIDGLSESQLRTFLKAGENNISVSLSLSSETTSIRQINGSDDLDVYYSLNGHRVTNPSHGIYIKNGKKIIL